jgi:glycosyltransferase involved in cell wall biosynthesis
MSTKLPIESSIKTGCVWYISKYVVPPGMGSAGLRGFLLMKELAKEGNRVVVITSDSIQFAKVPVFTESYLKQTIDQVDVWWVKTYKYQVAKSFKRILSWIDFELSLFQFPKEQLPNPDVVVISSLSLLTIMNGLWLRWVYNCRLVFEIRDIWPLTLTEEGGYTKNSILIRFLALIEKIGYRYADEIVGTVQNLGEHVHNILGYHRNVHCIPMGIDESAETELLPLPIDYIQKYIPSESLIVAHIGSIGIANALETFLACASEMSDHKHIHFLLIGDGDLKEEYVRRYGSLPNITFAPKIKKEMVHSAILHCDLVYFGTHPSEVWKYGQSLNKVIDYMNAGKPIIASFDGFPSMINEADCGIFVPPGDKESLRQAILNFSSMSSEDREKLGDRGKQWIRKFRTYDVLAKQYAKILFD